MRRGRDVALRLSRLALAGAAASVLALAAGAGAEDKPVAQGKGGESMGFKLTSTAFAQDSFIPKKHTGDGPDVSPPLAWTDPPAATKAFVLICDDPDAPVGTWVHWVFYDIPAAVRGLEENVPPKDTLADNSKQGTTDFRRRRYNGPAPPSGKPHRYFFKLYAVDRETGLAAGATKAQVLKAIEGHVLATAELMGKYQR